HLHGLNMNLMMTDLFFFEKNGENLVGCQQNISELYHLLIFSKS
ncbi:unnamed protein product, partial [Allacma fusca]